MAVLGRIGQRADRATRPTAQAPAGLGDTASVPCAFTAGPWQWFPSVSKERSAVIDTAIGVDSENGTIIAEVCRGKQFEGNANLIAAAPDMFEALAAILGNADELDIMALGDNFDRAVAALAKARGDQVQS
jgi:hypothetical protein